MLQSKTIEEAKENLKDAIILLLEDEKEDFQKDLRGVMFMRRKISIV